MSGMASPVRRMSSRYFPGSCFAAVCAAALDPATLHNAWLLALQRDFDYLSSSADSDSVPM
jgi:hypothetical protein